MISVGNRDANKRLGLGLGFGGGGGGGGREMEETELEEGEACSYNNNNNNNNNSNDDYDASIDPDIALSYIDEKLQHVLGHLQKDFEGGVSAENLGAKFGGYGSFLPAYQRSPVWSHPRTPPKVQNYNIPKSPNNFLLENGRRNYVVSSTAPPSLGPGPASSSTSLPALRACATNDSVKEEISITSSQAEEYVSRHESVNKRNLPDQKTLKVRIKVGSDNLSTQKIAAIYSGLGLDISPSSSLDDSPSESEGMDHEPLDAPFESPTNIIKVMTSFSVYEGSLLSPLPDYLVCLAEKEICQKDNRSMPFPKAGSESAPGSLDRSDSRMGDGKVIEKMQKSMEKNYFSVEFNSGKNGDAHSGFGAILKKEVDIDMLACEELVTEALKLPLLSNSYSTIGDTTKGTNMASDMSREPPRKRAMRDAVSSPVEEEPPETIYTEETDWYVNPKTVSAGKVWEDKKASSTDDVRKDGYCKRKKTFDSVKANSNMQMTRKALDAELIDPPKQMASHRVASHEDDTKLPAGMEHQSSGVKKKSRGSQSHSSVAVELPKESMKVSSSVSKNKKSIHAENYMAERESENKLSKDIEKAEDRYREFFGDLESEQEENKMNLLEIHSGDRLKDCEVVEKSAAALNIALKERPSGKKSDKCMTPGTHFKLVPGGAPPTGHGAVSDAAQVTTAPVLIKENWVCCDKCQKWRLLPLGTNPDNLPEKWLCSMLNWLPGMNRCNFSEEETTKALIGLYQIPGPESRNNPQINPAGVMSSVTLADVRQPYQNCRNFGSHALPHGGKKKHNIKEISCADKDVNTQLSNSMKKNIRASVRSESLNEMCHSPVVSEPDARQLSKSRDLSAEKYKHKQKEKQVLDHNSDGGDTKSLKMKSKRVVGQESFRASKKMNTEGLNVTDGDWIPDHGGGMGKRGVSNGLLTTSAGKEWSRHNDHSSRDTKSDTKDRIQVSAKVKDSLDDATAKKRKMKDCHEDKMFLGSLTNTGDDDIQGSRNFVEEFNENGYRKEKKARVSTSEGKESSISRGSGKADKKGVRKKNRQPGQDIGSTFSQRSLDGMDNKRDSGPVQPSVAAISSSSKVSGSHKNKNSLNEAKGSPVESVSSSPMRISNPDKGTSARMNLNEKSESHDTEFFGISSPRSRSNDEDEGGSDKSGTAKKDKFNVAPHGSVESPVLDIQDKDFSHLPGGKGKAIVPPPDITNSHLTNGSTEYLCQDAQRRRKPTIDECHDEGRWIDCRNHANGSRPRKSLKGSSSQSKDKRQSSKSDAVNGVQDHTPSSEVKPRDGRNKFQEKFGVKPDENEKRYVDKKDSGGKLFSESSKRENQLSLGGNGGPDAKVDTVCGRDAISTSKQSLAQDCNGERSSKCFISDKTDQVELVPGRGKSLSLPPSGGAQNDTPVHCPRPVHGSHKGNGSDISAADDCQVDDASKLPKLIKMPDHQNGSQQISSRHPTQNGHRVREVDAPSPARKDSSNQAANNAVKEAKDLKHSADRLKNSGSYFESIGLYFEAALKFLHGASLYESNRSESGRQGEMIQWIQIYSSTAKLCEFCAREYEKSKDMAAAALGYKCMEVAYMRVVYSLHAGASRDRHELQTALQMAPPGESPSSSASDVDNLNPPTTVDKVAFPKGVSSPQVTGNHIIAARNRPNLMRLLSFTQEVNFAMEASRKSRNAFAAANVNLGEDQHRDDISPIKRALDFNFQDVGGFLRLVRLAMDAISH